MCKKAWILAQFIVGRDSVLYCHDRKRIDITANNSGGFIMDIIY